MNNLTMSALSAELDESPIWCRRTQRLRLHVEFKKSNLADRFETFDALHGWMLTKRRCNDTALAAWANGEMFDLFDKTPSKELL